MLAGGCPPFRLPSACLRRDVLQKIKAARVNPVSYLLEAGRSLISGGPTHVALAFGLALLLGGLGCGGDGSRATDEQNGQQGSPRGQADGGE